MKSRGKKPRGKPRPSISNFFPRRVKINLEDYYPRGEYFRDEDSSKLKNRPRELCPSKSIFSIRKKFLQLREFGFLAFPKYTIYVKWLHREFIPAEILNAYVSKKTMEMNAVKTCNADKSTIFLCVMKCKTSGIQLACSDTGVVFGFRELYHAPK